MSNDHLRGRLQGIGQARLAAIGLATPPTTAPASSTNIFRKRQLEHEAAKRAPRVTSFTTVQLEHRANAMFVLERYKSADFPSRLKIRAEHGDLLALARQIEAEPPENEPPKSAA